MTQPAPLCFIDTETTGVHPERVAWEIAIIRRDYLGVGVDDRPVTEEQTLVLQVKVDLSQADPFALKIGGFYERHQDFQSSPVPTTGGFKVLSPEEARAKIVEHSARDPLVDEATAAKKVEQLTRGAHLVGTNPAFDAETLDRLLRRHRLIPAWDYHLVDVSAMALGYLNGVCAGAIEERGHRVRNLGSLGVDVHGLTTIPEHRPLQPPWKSDQLGEALGVQPATLEERHTALGDARWAMRMYDAMVGGTR